MLVFKVILTYNILQLSEYLSLGDTSGRELHLPIPNRNVKPTSADDSCRATGRENKSSPRLRYSETRYSDIIGS